MENKHFALVDDSYLSKCYFSDEVKLRYGVHKAIFYNHIYANFQLLYCVLGMDTFLSQQQETAEYS